MKQWITRRTVLGAVAFLVLVWLFSASYQNNIFNLLAPFSKFDEFQTDSEMSVLLMMQRTERDGLGSTGGLMIGIGVDSQGRGFRTIDAPIYLSAFGLQGQVFCVLNKILGCGWQRTTAIGHFWVALLTAIMMSLFVLYVRKTFGWVAAICLAIGALLSPWMVFAARNIYIMYLLKLLPFVLAMMLFPVYLDRPRFKLPYLLGIVGVAVLVNGLCYYDYISNTVMSLAIAPIYYGLARGLPRKKIAGWALALMVVGGAAVALAVLANIVKVGLWSGSLGQGFQHMMSTITSRAYGGANAAQAAPPGVSAWQILGNYWMIPALTLPGEPFNPGRLWFSFFFWVTTWVAFAAMAFLDGRRFPVFEAARPQLVGLAAATGWGLLAALSWGFLMKGHMWHHPHMNGMMFYIPYMLLAYIFFGKLLGVWGQQVLAWAGRFAGGVPPAAPVPVAGSTPPAGGKHKKR